jgi:PAS domain S-box-containing protein
MASEPRADPAGPTHAIVMATPDGIIRHWDAGGEELFGHASEAAIGRSLDLIVPPGFRERHWAAFREAVTTGVCKLDRAATNLPVLCRDGAVRAFPGRFVFLQGPRGEVVGAAALYSRPAGGEVPFGPIVPL